MFKRLWKCSRLNYSWFEIESKHLFMLTFHLTGAWIAIWSKIVRRMTPRYRCCRLKCWTELWRRNLFQGPVFAHTGWKSRLWMRLKSFNNRVNTYSVIWHAGKDATSISSLLTKLPIWWHHFPRGLRGITRCSWGRVLGSEGVNQPVN